MKLFNKKRGFTPHLLRGVGGVKSKHTKKGGGFTLMEIIVAVAIIVIALATSIALISFSISGIRTGKSKIIATNLAQEGLEIVRNIRDSNWLSYKRKPENWRDDLGEGDWLVQYDDTVLSQAYSENNYLNINNDGLYQYDTGTPTAFDRKVTIEYIGNNQIKIISEVTWQEKGRNYPPIRVEGRLYNWLEE